MELTGTEIALLSGVFAEGLATKGGPIMFPVPWRGKSSNVSVEKTHPLEQFRREFDVLFDRFFSDWPAPFEPEAAGVRMWDFDVSDSDNEVIVKAELPGFDDKDLDVQVNDNLLTIKAEKQRKGDGEREYRSFRRTITLP